MSEFLNKLFFLSSYKMAYIVPLLKNALHTLPNGKYLVLMKQSVEFYNRYQKNYNVILLKNNNEEYKGGNRLKADNFWYVDLRETEDPLYTIMIEAFCDATFSTPIIEKDNATYENNILCISAEKLSKSAIRVNQMLCLYVSPRYIGFEPNTFMDCVNFFNKYHKYYTLMHKFQPRMLKRDIDYSAEEESVSRVICENLRGCEMVIIGLDSHNYVKGIHQHGSHKMIIQYTRKRIAESVPPKEKILKMLHQCMSQWCNEHYFVVFRDKVITLHEYVSANAL